MNGGYPRSECTSSATAGGIASECDGMTGLSLLPTLGLLMIVWHLLGTEEVGVSERMNEDLACVQMQDGVEVEAGTDEAALRLKR